MVYKRQERARRRVRGHVQLRVGLISDIHADLPALEAALDVLERAGVDRIVCMGDVVQKGPDGEEVVELMQRLLIPTVAGNHDDSELALGRMSRSAREWLVSLPDKREYSWCGKSIMLAHESPLREGWVFPGQVPKKLKRYLRGREVDVLCLGHTHVPMRMEWRNMLFLNPGSVSRGRRGFPCTCAVLELPTLEYTVLDVQTGRRVKL